MPRKKSEISDAVRKRGKMMEQAARLLRTTTGSNRITREQLQKIRESLPSYKKKKNNPHKY